MAESHAPVRGSRLCARGRPGRLGAASSAQARFEPPAVLVSENRRPVMLRLGTLSTVAIACLGTVAFARCCRSKCNDCCAPAATCCAPAPATCAPAPASCCAPAAPGTAAPTYENVPAPPAPTTGAQANAQTYRSFSFD